MPEPATTAEPPPLYERVAHVEAILPTLATKADLANLEIRLIDRIGATETRLGGRIDSLRNWIIATLISMFVGFGTLAITLYAAVKP